MLGFETGGPWPDDESASPRHRWDVVNAWLDRLAIAAAFFLILLGALNLYAVAGRGAAVRQLAVVAPGVVLFVALRRVRIERLAALGWVVYGLSVALLAAVPVVGMATKGARRWIGVGAFSVQPSELAKLGLLLILAHVLSSERSPGKRLGYAVGLWAVPTGLTLLQPDLSTAMLLTALLAAMLFLARIPWRYLLPSLGAAMIAAPLALPLLHDYQLQRLQGFLTGSADMAGGYTLQQAHIAVAMGGLTGRFSDEAQRLLAEYLPENHTDLAFASVAQQFGLVAVLIALALTVLIVWRIALGARGSRTSLGMLVGAGLAVLFGTQVAISVAGNLGLLPIAGIPFPLLSYGGSAAIVYLAAFGVVIAARRDGTRRRLWAPPRWSRPSPRGLARLAFGLTVAMGGSAWYGHHLQTARGDSLRQAGLTQMTRCVRLPASRGLITDRHGALLAGNNDHSEVAGIPAVLKRAAPAVTTLAGLLGRPTEDVTRTVSSSDGMLVKLGQVDGPTGQRISDAKLPGVALLPSPQRIYPAGTLVGAFLGYTGADTEKDHQRWPALPIGERVGRAGLERRYDPVLRGVAGEQCFLVDPKGRPVALDRYRPPVPGLNLRLSIDLGLQQQMSDALGAAVGRSGGDLGGAVALDPKTGQVLAMASVPSMDNNVYGPPLDEAALAQAKAAPGHPSLQHVTQVAAPPGSIFKPVVAAANLALPTPVLPPNVVIPTGGSFTHQGHTFNNWKALGPQSLVGAIAWSNDVYFYKLGVMLGPERIHEIGTALGAGVPTGIDLDESAGELGTPESIRQRGGTWYSAATVVLGIGQGHITTTPVQAARWTAAIATGRLVTPRLGLDFAAPDQPATAAPAAPPSPLPFAGALGPVRDGMRQVVGNGTATILRDVGFPVLAKTGTAEDPAAPNGETDAWLVAAAPADDPGIAIAVLVRGGGHGGETAAPVAKSALQYFAAHRTVLLGGSAAPAGPPPGSSEHGAPTPCRPCPVNAR
ncbi:MAG TPA: FtsW/RodA/SpoVE family cell cycle protein [Acidimicrobiia bacterium]|nr:FtsW/RodA/SpoVE family cell cycle protein [Acidimicrobiia bacterium]